MKSEPIIGNVVISEVHAPMYIVLNKGEKNTCLIGNHLAPQNVWRYIRGVAPTEVVITRVRLYLSLVLAWI